MSESSGSSISRLGSGDRLPQSTSARMAHPSSICSSVMFRAGSSRTTWPCVALIRSRRSRHSATTAEASNVRSRPIITPEDPDVADQVGQLARGAPRSGRGTARRSARPRSSRPSCSIVSIGRQPGAAGDRVAAEGARVHPRLEDRGDVRRGHHHPRRDPAGQGLGAGQDVGGHVAVLVGEPLARPAHAGLHLVEDQQARPRSSQSLRRPVR